MPNSQPRFAAVTLRSLLDEPSLQLRAIHVSEAYLDREVRWVTVTELVDPSPYLLGDELILTLGSSWPDPDSPEIDRFIERISTANVTAVGISLGFDHDRVPQRLIDAASQYDLPLIDVPIETSFRSIGEHVVERIARDRYAAVQQNLDSYEALTDALLSRLGLDGLLDTLRRKIGRPIAILDYHGNVLASRPEREPWAVTGIVASRLDLVHGSIVDGLAVYPIMYQEHVVAFLVSKGEADHEAEATIKFAIGLVALELSRRQAELHGRRELLGQVLGDYVQGDLADHEAERRLNRAGLVFDTPHRVLLARVLWPSERLAGVPWNGDMFLREHASSYVVAQVDGLISVIAPEGVPIEALARSTAQYLQQLGPTTIGYGGLYSGIAGLRLSWLEAQESLRHGGQGGSTRTMNMSRIVLANMKVPLKHIGEEALRPILDYDRQHSANLLATLTSFLENDCQTSETATALFVHRNTLRYRLQLIERLTSRDLSSFEDLVDLHLSLKAMETSG